MLGFFTLFFLSSCLRVGNLINTPKAGAREVLNRMLTLESQELVDDDILEKYLERDVISREEPGIFLEEAVNGMTLLHVILEENRTESFKSVCKYLHRKEMLAQAMLKQDSIGRLVPPTSFAFSPEAFAWLVEYIEKDAADADNSVLKTGWCSVRSSRAEFNALVVNLELLGGGCFRHLADHFDRCKENIIKLMSILGEDAFYESFFRDRIDLYLLLKALVCLEDISIAKLLLEGARTRINFEDLYFAATKMENNIMFRAIRYKSWKFLDLLIENTMTFMKIEGEKNREIISEKILSLCGRFPLLHLSEITENGSLKSLSGILSGSFADDEIKDQASGPVSDK